MQFATYIPPSVDKNVKNWKYKINKVIILHVGVIFDGFWDFRGLTRRFYLIFHHFLLRTFKSRGCDRDFKKSKIAKSLGF